MGRRKYSDKIVSHLVADCDQAICQMCQTALDQTEDLLAVGAEVPAQDMAMELVHHRSRTGAAQRCSGNAPDPAPALAVCVWNTSGALGDQFPQLANRSSVGTKRQFALK